jgi:hypothetical protein
MVKKIYHENEGLRSLPYMLYADSKGRIYDDPYLRMAGFSGSSPADLNSASSSLFLSVLPSVWTRLPANWKSYLKSRLMALSPNAMRWLHSSNLDLCGPTFRPWIILQNPISCQCGPTPQWASRKMNIGLPGSGSNTTTSGTLETMMTGRLFLPYENIKGSMVPGHLLGTLPIALPRIIALRPKTCS